jgi:hypothetical protein
VAVEEILFAAVPDRRAAIEALGLSDRDRAARRWATLESHLRERGEAIEIGDEPVRAYYEAHPGALSRGETGHALEHHGNRTIGVPHPCGCRNQGPGKVAPFETAAGKTRPPQGERGRKPTDSTGNRSP